MRLSRVRLTIRSMMLVLIGVALLHRRGCPRRTVRRRPTVAALEAIPPPGAAPPRGVALVLPGDGVLAPVAAHRRPSPPGRAGPGLDGGDLLLLRHPTDGGVRHHQPPGRGLDTPSAGASSSRAGGLRLARRPGLGLHRTLHPLRDCPISSLKLPHGSGSRHPSPRARVA